MASARYPARSSPNEGSAENPNEVNSRSNALARAENVSCGISSAVYILLLVYRVWRQEKRGSDPRLSPSASSILATGSQGLMAAPGQPEGKRVMSARNPASRAAISRFSINAPEERYTCREARIEQGKQTLRVEEEVN